MLIWSLEEGVCHGINRKSPLSLQSAALETAHADVLACGMLAEYGFN